MRSRAMLKGIPPSAQPITEAVASMPLPAVSSPRYLNPTTGWGV